jgi:hypothetical protein
MSQWGCGFFTTAESLRRFVLLQRMRTDARRSSCPGPCSIVSHPPRIAAGWGSLGLGGVWASPQKQKINLAKVLALLNAAWPNRSGLEKIEDKSSWDSVSGMGAGLTDLFSRGYRERDAGCPTRGGFTGGPRCRWDQEILRMRSSAFRASLTRTGPRSS